VCHFLYPIIFVPYNLFKLFLVHKISAYIYIWEKEMGKEKEKGFPACWARGRFWPIRARARGCGRGRQPTRPISEETAWDGAMARAHTSARGGGVNGAERATEGGKPTEARPPVKSRGGSLPWVRFCGGGEVARHGRG
jgi:hypothetical protein